MARPSIANNREMMDSDHGKRLYAYWKRILWDTDSPEFETYPGFYKWAMEAGYTSGANLLRRDGRAPYSPDNCVWIFREEGPAPMRDKERETLWDETVNRIRVHFGMEPIHSSEV